MQRSQIQFRSAQQWWEAFQAAPAPRASAEDSRDLQLLLEALESVSQDLELAPGTTSKNHLPQVLQVLTELQVEPDCLAAACACFITENHGAERLPAISPRLLKLVEEVGNVNQLYQAHLTGPSPQDNAEGLRRLLLAMIGDVRVVLLQLAEALVRLRASARAPVGIRRKLALQAQQIHGPLANRLGIWQVKWELEDLTFRYLQPSLYKRIAGLLDERRSDRESYIAGVIDEVRQMLGKAGIQAEVVGRPKHIFSIWKKMQRKGLAFHELYDVRAIRILVDELGTCYSALGLVHSLWPPIPGEFDDYVANPKQNMYQSLHTAVIGPGGKAVEVQIRTHEMHAHSELGVAAHWRYKEGSQRDPGYERKIGWMRQLLEGRDERVMEAFTEPLNDRVYVLTPKGKVLDMPAGSTVLDFAYHIHTDVGHNCRGAKVNGRIVPLTHNVSNGEQIEILTARNGAPSRDWLNPQLGYLHGARSRAKVRQWFKRVDYDRNVSLGRDLIDRELKRLGLHAANLEKITRKLNFTKLDDLFAAVAVGDVTAIQVARQAEEQLRPAQETLLTPKRQSRQKPQKALNGVSIDGVGNLLTTFAKCCAPVPGEPIIGYITRGRGVTIHRSDCRSVLRLMDGEADRIIEVGWTEAPGDGYGADVRIHAYDRKGLLKDISTLLTNERTNILSLTTQSDEGLGTAEFQLRVQVKDFDHLSRVLNRLNGLRNIIEAHRVS